MTRTGILAVALAAMVTIACGGNRDTDANRPGDTPAVGTAGERPAGTDANANRDANRDAGMGVRNWVEDRLEGGMREVKLGELASQNAQSADVKAFGRMMVQDHTKSGEELKQIASKHNITAPADAGEDNREAIERLSKLKGAEFDREYMNMMVEDHEKTMDALEERLDNQGDEQNPRYSPKQSENAIENELNQWAAKAAPTVRKHLERARQIDQKLDQRTTENPNRQ